MRPARSVAPACAAALLLLASLDVGCTASEVPPTQLLVEVSADASVAAKLQYVRAFLYPLGATDEGQWRSDAQFALAPADGSAAGLRFPLSFGVAKGDAERFELVIKGYESADPGAPAVIEHKALASFTPGQKRTVRMALRDACYQQASTCAGLARTCAPGPRGAACVAVAEASSDGDAITPGDAEASDGGVAADATSPRAPSAEGGASSPAGAVADGGVAAVVEVTAGGTGCPAGTWQADVQGMQGTVTLSALRARIGASTSSHAQRCSLSVRVRGPKPVSYVLESFSLKGEASLDADVRADLNVDTYFVDAPDNGYEYGLAPMGPYARTVELSNLPETPVSTCTQDAVLSVLIDLTVSRRGSGAGVGTVFTDPGARYTFAIAERPCAR